MTPERAKELLPIIQAFAEGKTIQRKSKVNDAWGDIVGQHSFLNDYEYRLKPKTVKFRTALFKYSLPNTGLFVSSVLDAKSENFVEQLPQFVRWLGDWQEVSEDDPNS